jgi:hypothetical protein
VNGVERDVIRVKRYLNWIQGDIIYIEMDLDTIDMIENEESISLGGYSMDPKTNVLSLV